MYFFFFVHIFKIRTTNGKVLLSSASEAIQAVVQIERRVEAASPVMQKENH